MEELLIPVLFHHRGDSSGPWTEKAKLLLDYGSGQGGQGGCRGGQSCQGYSLNGGERRVGRLRDEYCRRLASIRYS